MANSVACHFYAKGNCRYGDNCRFSHANPNRNGQGQSAFGGGQDSRFQGTIPSSTQNADPLGETMMKDMMEWEKSKIWPFSSYGPITGKPCLPYFSDLSEEEVRYQTLQNGGVTPQELNVKLSECSRMRMQILQNPSMSKTLIDQVLNSTAGQNPTSSQQQFQPTAAANAFFGQPQQQQSPSFVQPSTTIFGGSSPNQVIGQPNQNFSGFAQQPNQTAPSFSFKVDQVNPAVVTGMDAAWTNVPSPQPPTNATNFSFTQALAQNVASSPFLPSQQVIPQQTPVISGFPNAMPQPPQSQIWSGGMTAGSGSGMPFGTQPQVQGPAPINKYVYSQLSDLTPEEIQEYEAENFTNCDSIPLKPPTREMCLKN